MHIGGIDHICCRRRRTTSQLCRRRRGTSHDNLTLILRDGVIEFLGQSEVVVFFGAFEMSKDILIQFVLLSFPPPGSNKPEMDLVWRSCSSFRRKRTTPPSGSKALLVLCGLRRLKGYLESCSCISMRANSFNGQQRYSPFHNNQRPSHIQQSHQLHRTLPTFRG